MDRMKSYLSGCKNMSLKLEDSFCSWFSANTMRPGLFKVPSKFLLISCICWFAIVRNMGSLLSTAYAPITANENLENKPYLCLVLLAKLADLLVPVDARSILLGIFDPFYFSRDCIPLGKLDNCWEIWCVVNFLVIWTFNNFRDIQSLSGRTFLYMQYGLQQHEHVIIILWGGICLLTWGFSGIFINICSEQSVPEVNILWRAAL